MHRPAIEHLRRTDPALAKIIDEIGPCEMKPHTIGTHFDALVRAIVYQQLSGKAAATIHGRFQGLYGNRPPTPQEVLETDEERLRSVGLSRQKIASIRDLSSKVASGDVAIDALDAMPDDDIIESLVRVRGIGRWSAQMFLMFRLGRPNVLPDLDLGVQKGMQHAYRLPGLPTPKDVLRIGERWAPFASVASWYMWRMLELPRVIQHESAARSAARTARKPADEKAATVRTTATRPTTTRKAAPRKSAVRKSAVRKSAVRKSAVRKTKARKTKGRKTTARKTTARKATARKTTARKATARKKAASRKAR